VSATNGERSFLAVGRLFLQYAKCNRDAYDSTVLVEMGSIQLNRSSIAVTIALPLSEEQSQGFDDENERCGDPQMIMRMRARLIYFSGFRIPFKRIILIGFWGLESGLLPKLPPTKATHSTSDITFWFFARVMTMVVSGEAEVQRVEFIV
jgi:hypothetical protein